MNLKKNRKVFTSKFVGTGPSSYEKRIYCASVSQRLRNTALKHQVMIVAHFESQTLPDLRNFTLHALLKIKLRKTVIMTF